MKQVSRFVTIIVALLFATDSIVLAIGSKNAAYFGGTVNTFEGATDPIEGVLDTRNADQLVFTSIEKKFRGKTFSIPYARVLDLEYGQKAGRRVGTAVATTVLLGPIGLLSLLSKKRKHYLTIGFKDNTEKDQVAVIELGKDIVRSTLPIVETRSGKKIAYQDEEARKSGR
ncbi:MAG TPA: hypothetical protein VE422_41800 [Terriglobia bacterium]|nr:hypothetical protein [Terriglobia bacterium]